MQNLDERIVFELMLFHVRFQNLEALVTAGVLQHGGQVHSFVFFNGVNHLAYLINNLGRMEVSGSAKIGNLSP